MIAVAGDPFDLDLATAAEWVTRMRFPHGDVRYRAH
jgi:hypothetical protein